MTPYWQPTAWAARSDAPPSTSYHKGGQISGIGREINKSKEWGAGGITREDPPENERGEAKNDKRVGSHKADFNGTQSTWRGEKVDNIF